MPNASGLDDDFDPIDALVDIEKAFKLSISDEEATSCTTVGDIYDLLHARFINQIGDPGSSMTSMAFYRVRKVLRVMHPDASSKPSTKLEAYTNRNARSFLERLRRDSGLRVPRSQARWFTGVGYLLAIPAIPAALIAAINLPTIFCLIAIGLFMVGATLVRLDPGALPKDCGTVGDLARKVSALNYGLFTDSGAAVRPKPLWDALAEVLSRYSELPKSDMCRDTLILDHKPHQSQPCV